MFWLGLIIGLILAAGLIVFGAWVHSKVNWPWPIK